MIEAVLFDVGDTLLHFERAKAKAYLATAVTPAYQRLRELGFVPPPYAKYQRAVVRAFQRAYIWSRLRRREVHLVNVYRRLHRRMGMRLSDEQLNDLARQCTVPIRRFFTMDDEAQKVPARLHAAGLRLGLVSNTLFPGFAIDDVLRQDGLLDYFPARVYSSDVRYMKPNPQIYRVALERLGAVAERTLFVGDHLNNDVRGPARLGMHTALVARNGRLPRGRGRPDYVIRRLGEIPAILSV